MHLAQQLVEGVFQHMIVIQLWWGQVYLGGGEKIGEVSLKNRKLI